MMTTRCHLTKEILQLLPEGVTNQLQLDDDWQPLISSTNLEQPKPFKFTKTKSWDKQLKTEGL